MSAPFGRGSSGGARSAAYAQYAALCASEWSAPEAAFVRDVLFCAQGIDGAFLRFDASSGRHALAPGARLPPAASALALRLCGAGALYRSIRARLARWAGPGCGDGGGAAAGCAATRSLAAAAESELADYARLLAGLEERAQAPLPGPGSPAAEHGAPYATLRSLAVWLAEPTARLAALDGLLAPCGGRAGGEAASALARAAAAGAWAGDPGAAPLAAALLRAACDPLLRDTAAWVTRGELPPPGAGFFVVERAPGGSAVGGGDGGGGGWDDDGGAVDARFAPEGGLGGGGGGGVGGGVGGGDGGVGVGGGGGSPAAAAAAAAALWRRRYALRPSCTPPFLTPAQAGDALRCGVTLRFLRTACADRRWADDGPAALAAASAAAAGGAAAGAAAGSLSPPGSDPSAVAAALVATASACADARLRSLLLAPPFSLQAHLAALKRYLLLGQGDFVDALMARAGPLLGEPASAQSPHLLGGALEAAVRASAAQHDDPAVLARLRVRLLPCAGAGELGWDVFSLAYDLGPPLGGLLLSPPCAAAYLRAFNFLWRLKRVEHALAGAWGGMKPASAAGGGGNARSPAFGGGARAGVGAAGGGGGGAPRPGTANGGGGGGGGGARGRAAASAAGGSQPGTPGGGRGGRPPAAAFGPAGSGPGSSSGLGPLSAAAGGGGGGFAPAPRPSLGALPPPPPPSPPPPPTPLAVALLRLHGLRSRCAHFMSSLQYYLQCEVLETSWQALQSDLDSAPDFGALLAAHASYLESVTAKALLGPRCSVLAEQLGELFGVALRLAALCARAAAAADEAAARAALAGLAPAGGGARGQQQQPLHPQPSLSPQPQLPQPPPPPSPHPPPPPAPPGPGDAAACAAAAEAEAQVGVLGDAWDGLVDGFVGLLPTVTRHVDASALLFRLGGEPGY